MKMMEIQVRTQYEKPFSPSPRFAIVFGTRFGCWILLDRDQFDERKIAMVGYEVQRCAKLNLRSAHAVAQAGIHSICA